MAKKANSKRATVSEQEFLATYDASEFPHPSLAVDIALITVDQAKLKALLLQRDQHPAKGKWALPGSFVGIKESLDQAAGRGLEAKTGVSGIFLEQLYTFGRPDRDPRTRVVTVAYYALVDVATLVKQFDESKQARLIELAVPWTGEAGDAVEARDETGKQLPIAFDHARILGMAVSRLRGKLNYADIGFELLPRKFTLRQLQTIHETILGRSVNKDSFRRRLIASRLIAPTGQLEQSVGHRPAELYRFKRKRH